jgi:ABC-type glutathione transport system ATPase component
VNAPLLSLSITAGYARKPRVLDGLQLDVHEGEILGLVGGSGEGKSTITMPILGLLWQNGGYVNGEVRFRGRIWPS